jgi:hypothetical protein
MAYKFQLGSARLSGSTTFEQPLVVEDSFSAASLSASAGLQVGGTVELDGVLDETAVPASDSFYILDASDGLMKRESMSAYATTIAGDGLAAASGVLKVDVSDFAGAGLEDDGSENLRIAAAAAGAGLGGGAGSALSVNVDDSSIEINSDTLRVKAAGVTDAMLHDDVADGLAGIGLSAASGVMSLDIDEFAELDAAPHATEDEFLVSDNGTEKRVSMTNVSKGVFALVTGGDATIAANGSLTIAADSVEGSMLATTVADTSTIELSNDNLSVLKVPNAITVDNATLQLNSGTTYDGGAARTISIKDGGVDADAIASAVAGAGLAGGGGSALSVQVSGALGLAAGGDHIGLSGSVAGSGLSFEGGAKSISSLDLSIGEFSTVQVDSGDKFLMLDSNGLTHQLETVDSLSEFQAGAGLAHSSGVLSVGVDGSTVELSGDAIRVKAVGINVSHLHADVAGNGLSGGGGSALAVDLNELSAAVVDVAADSIAIIDATDNSSKKESIADFVGQLPAVGGGLDASGGKLTVADVVTQLGDSNASLAFGINVQTSDMTAARKHTLPVPVAGRKIVVKGKNTGTHNMTIEVDDTAATKIDGAQTSIVIESDAGAVTLLCTSASRWIIV